MVYDGIQDQLLLANKEIQRLSSELEQRNKKITTLDLESSNNVDKIQRLENELEKFRMMNSDLEQKMREHDRDKDQLLM
jgi:dynactin complex subunit